MPSCRQVVSTGVDHRGARSDRGVEIQGYRRPELGPIRRALTAPAAGGSACVIVRGEPGSGKTTLRNQLVDLLDGRQVVQVDGAAAKGAAPYGALHRGLVAAGPALEGVADAVRLADQVCLTDETFLLALTAATVPVVIAVDDFHLLDPDSSSLLTHVLASAHRHRIPISAVFVLRTPGADVDPDVEMTLDQLSNARAVSAVDLTRLAPTEQRRLAHHLLGAQPDAGLLAHLDATTNGLLFAVARSLSALERRDLLVHRGGEVSLREPPLSVLDSDGSGLEPLAGHPAHRAIAAGLAVLGAVDQLSMAVVAQYLEVGLDEVHTTVEVLVRQRLLDEADGELRFSHELVRSDLANGLGPHLRAGVHRLAAQRLDASAPDTPAGLAELAHHLAESIGPGDTVQAARLADIALQLMAFAPRAALRLLDRAVPQLEPGSTSHSTAARARLRLLQRLGRHEQTIAEADSLLTDATDPDLLDPTGVAITTSLLLACRWSTARVVADHVIARAPDRSTRTAVVRTLVLALSRQLHEAAAPRVHHRTPGSPVVDVLTRNADTFAWACGAPYLERPEPIDVETVLAPLGPIEAAVALTQLTLFHSLAGELGVVHRLRAPEVLDPVAPLLAASDALGAICTVGESFAMLLDGRWRELAERSEQLEEIGRRWAALATVVQLALAEVARRHDHHQPAIELITELDRIPAMAPLLAASAAGALAADGRPTEALQFGYEQLDADRRAGGHLYRHVLLSALHDLEPDPGRRRELCEELDQVAGRTGSGWAAVHATVARARDDRDGRAAADASTRAADLGLWPLAHYAAALAAEFGLADGTALTDALLWAGEHRHHELYLQVAGHLRALGAFPPVGTRRRATGPTEMDRLLVIAVARGATNQEIADRLGVGAGTVKTYLQRLYRKLGVSNRSEFVAVTARSGWRQW